MYLFTRLTTIVFFASLFIIGCKKETSNSSLTPQEEEEAATVSSESETEQELVFNDVFDNVIGVNNEVGLSGVGVFGKMAPNSSGSARELRVDSVRCFSVVVTRIGAPNLFPVKIVLDFGNGCLGKDGHKRYGKIITTYTGRLTVPGKSATTVFDGFKIDDISVQGTHVITNTTAPGSNQRQFTIEVTDAKLSKANGNYSQWNSKRIVTQVEGNGTPEFPADDIFTITGHSNGKVKHENHLYAWQSEITEPLIKKFICPWIVKGIIKVRRESLSTTSAWVATLNYGKGDCDNKATLTVNGVERQITLH